MSSYVIEHRSEPGGRVDRSDYTYTPGRCGGIVRSLYTRDGGRWVRVALLCLRCATVEVVGGTLRGYARADRDPEPYIGRLLPVSTPADVAGRRHLDDVATAAGVDAAPAQRLHPDDRRGVDTDDRQ